MAGFVQSMVTNTLTNAASGFVTSGVATIGAYTGDAVAGVGNLIENAGAGVGNGIAGKFDNWGNAIRSYGNSVQRATAPNASSVSSRAVVPANKPGQKNAVSKATVKTSGPQTRYTGTEKHQTVLPASTPRKKLPAPPIPKALPAPEKKSLPTTERKALSGPEKKSPASEKKASSVVGGPAIRSGGPAALPNLPSAKDAAAKVRISKESMPKSNVAYKPPAPSSTDKNSTNKSTPSYAPPTKNAKGKVSISKESRPGAPKPASTASYQPPKNGGQKYEGPLKLPSGLAPSAPSKSGQNGQKYEGPLKLPSGIAPTEPKKPDQKSTPKNAPKSNGPQPKLQYDFF